MQGAARISVGPDRGTAIALAGALHDRNLRRREITVRKAVDCLITAWCILRDVSLLHADHDFLPFAEHCGLRIQGTGRPSP